MKTSFPETQSLDRRRFLEISALAFGGAMLHTPALRAAEGNRYQELKSKKYLGKVRIETKIEDKEVFTEGPAVDRDGIVYFTNVPVEKILKWDPQAKKLSVFRENSHQTNGLLFDPDGNLLACEGGAGRVTRTDMRTGKITVLADKYNGFPLAAPNDFTLDEKRADLFFVKARRQRSRERQRQRRLSDRSETRCLGQISAHAAFALAGRAHAQRDCHLAG